MTPRTTSALELYRESERVAATSRRTPSLRAITTDTIGMVLYDLRRYREAEGQFQRALQVHRSTGDRRQQAISLTHLGWVYGDTNRLAEAERTYREALELLTAVGDRFNLAFALDGLGEVLGLRGQWEEALARHRAALRTAEQAPDSNQEAISLTNMARALGLGRLDEALDVIHRAVDLTESGRLTRPGSRGRTSWTARNRDRYELLVSLLWDLQQRTPDPARVAEMFGVSERARARTLLDLLTEARVDLYQLADPEPWPGASAGTGGRARLRRGSPAHAGECRRRAGSPRAAPCLDRARRRPHPAEGAASRSAALTCARAAAGGGRPVAGTRRRHRPSRVPGGRGPELPLRGLCGTR